MNGTVVIVNTSLFLSNGTVMNYHSKVENAVEPKRSPDEFIVFKVVKILLYTFILMVSMTGNCLVIAVIYRSVRMKINASNLLILNLALCDLLTPLISVPFDLVVQEKSYTWPFGLAMCKLLAPLATFTSTSSSLTLACIALDRYRAVMHPFKTKLSLRQIKYMVLALHGFSLLVVAPYIVFLDVRDGTSCSEYWPDFAYRQVYTVILFLVQYALPLVFMLGIYILTASEIFKSSTKLQNILLPNRAKHKMALNLKESFVIRRESNKKVWKMFASVVAVFVVCTFPNEVFWLWSDFADGHKYEKAFYVAIICHWFTYANSCFNPLIFYVYNKDFNDGFRSIFRKIFCKGKNIERLHRPLDERNALDIQSCKAEMKSNNSNNIDSRKNA